ncbi:MAG: ABC transporter ATP-binding protein, partial [Clostridia bacterium]
MKKTHLLKFVLSYGKGKKWLVACALIFTLGAVASSLLLPVLIGNAIDFLVGVGQVDFVKILIQLVYIICAIAVGFLCQWLASICANSLSYYITQGVRNDFFAHLNKLPLSTIDGAKHGEIVSRLTTDVETIGAGLLQGFSSLFSGVITIAGTLGLMFFINPIIAGVVVLLTPLSIIFAMFIAKRVHTQFAKQAKIQGEITAFTQEKLGGQKTIKAFGQEQSCQQSFKDINDKLYECGLKAQLYSAFVNPTTRFINNIIYAIVGVIGAVLAVFFGKITAGTLTTFLLYSNHYTKPFNEISGVIAELQSAFASAQRVDDFLKLALESSDIDC